MSATALYNSLVALHEILAANGLWHVLAYGTLLGAVRDGDIVPWDKDFDLLARPEDREAILALGPELAKVHMQVSAVRRPATHLALRPRGLQSFDTGCLTVRRSGRKVGDIFFFSVFSDGAMRRYDFGSEVYWSPHMSFPHFFLAEPAFASLRGRPFPAVAHAEAWLASIYGADWTIPRRNRQLGGPTQAHRNIYGHRVAPRLHKDMAWCVRQGWDRGAYADRPAWPRDVRGAGPLGPMPRTEDNSRSLWWRDLDELLRHF